MAITFTTSTSATQVTVNDSGHGALANDFVTFSSANTGNSSLNAVILNAEHQIVSVPTANTYTFTASIAANASDSGNGGAATDAAYQISVGPETVIPLIGFGAGKFNVGPFNVGSTSSVSLRQWSQSNFGEDLIFGPRGGAPFYWDATNDVTTRGVALSSLGGASNTPTIQNIVFVSDINRFVFCFGTNALGTTTQDPLLFRWSDQENAADWTPSTTNQSGSLRLSRGTKIVAVEQSNQAVNIWTDSSIYNLQFLGGQAVFGVELIGDNISIASQNAVAFANGVSYWMGNDRFYKYDGRVQTLNCSLLRYIINDINTVQLDQVFAGTNKEFNEVWWFYCSSGSTTVDKYVIYNYEYNIWYYGTLARTAWLDSGMRTLPLAATYRYNLVNHEEGIDDVETNTPAAINAYITSSEIDLQGGDKFGFVWRVLPDMTFEGSTIDAPNATMTLNPLQNSGSGYNSPLSEGGNSAGAVTRSATAPVEAYTGQVNIRVRGRQMSMKIESTNTGVQWQLGHPRIDVRADGGR